MENGVIFRKLKAFQQMVENHLSLITLCLFLFVGQREGSVEGLQGARK